MGLQAAACPLCASVSLPPPPPHRHSPWGESAPGFQAKACAKDKPGGREETSLLPEAEIDHVRIPAPGAQIAGLAYAPCKAVIFPCLAPGAFNWEMTMEEGGPSQGGRSLALGPRRSLWASCTPGKAVYSFACRLCVMHMCVHRWAKRGCTHPTRLP